MDGPLHNAVIGPMLQKASVRTYAKGQIILYPQDTMQEVFVIKAGAVTMHDVDSQENQKILYIFGPETLFPMTSFSDESVSISWFYTALTVAKVWVLPYGELKSRLEKAEGVNAYNLFLCQLLGEVHELLVRLSNMTKTDSYQKLVTALKFLARYHTEGSQQWRRVRFPVSHQLLADMTGLTRETVTVTCKKLQDQGVVRSPGLAKLELQVVKLKQIKI